MESQTKKSKYEIDMCNGTIMDKLISFSLPLMLSGISTSPSAVCNVRLFT